MRRSIVTDEVSGVSLRRLEAKDAANMLEWMHDIDVVKNYKQNFQDMTEEQVLRFIATGFTEENQHFAIVDSEDEYLGTISLKNISLVNRNAEYAIVVRPKKQRGGVGSIATKLVLEYAFGQLKLHKVYLNVPSDNIKAARFYEKCGFVYEGTFKKHLMMNGEFRDLSWYGILAE